MRHPHLDAVHLPDGFVPVRSHLDGVEVYAPAGDPAPRADRGLGAVREARACACGLELAVEPGARRSACPACGRPLAERVVAGSGPRPARCVPFAIDAARAAEVARAFWEEGWRRPRAPAGLSEGLVALWVPVWVVGSPPGRAVCACPPLAALVEGRPVDGAAPYDPDALGPAAVGLPTLEADDARLAVGEVDPAIPAELVLVPVWAWASAGAGGPWRVEVDGRTGAVRGRRPVDWGRVRARAMMGLAPGLFLGTCVGLPTLVAAGFGLLVWAVALAFLLVGAASALRLQARALDEEGR